MCLIGFECCLVVEETMTSMIVTLERNGFIRRQPGVPRSIEILVPLESLPILEWLGIKTSKSLG